MCGFSVVATLAGARSRRAVVQKIMTKRHFQRAACIPVRELRWVPDRRRRDGADWRTTIRV